MCCDAELARRTPKLKLLWKGSSEFIDEYEHIYSKKEKSLPNPKSDITKLSDWDFRLSSFGNS